MHITRRQALSASATIAVLPLSLRAQAQISTAVAINRSARFRALSQRCAKLYCQQVLGVMSKPAADTLVVAQRLFQTGLDDLQKAQLTGDAAAQLRTVQQDISAYNGLLADTPARDKLPAVRTQANKLLDNADRLTSLIEQASKRESAGIINISGRQRMLSQRMAKNYFYTAANAANTQTAGQIQNDREAFGKAIQTLDKASISNPSIRNDLDLLRSQWLFFEGQLAKAADPTGLQTMATTSERLLEVANSLTNHYEAALRDLLGTT